MKMNTLYLAYGSNLNLKQMSQRCPNAKLLGATELQDYELLFRGRRARAVATIEPHAGASVPVLLWRLTKMDEATLDLYEGVPNTYTKRTLHVPFKNRMVKAMTYSMASGFYAGNPSREYLSRIAVGYVSAGFDLGILRAAVQRSIKLAELEYTQTQQIQL